MINRPGLFLYPSSRSVFVSFISWDVFIGMWYNNYIPNETQILSLQKEGDPMKRCVIVGGAGITDYEFVRGYLKDDDYVVYCDCGLKHRDLLEREPDLIVGDFDSHENPQLDIETIVLPVIKNDTDTVFAVKEALSRGFEDFLLLGVTGNRLDHTLGNVSILLMLDTMGRTAKIVDDYSEMEIVSQNGASVDDTWAYFSLLNISGEAEEINIQNAKYELQDAEIDCEWQYGVSNEPIAGKTAEITVGKGRLLLIRIRPGN